MQWDVAVIAIAGDQFIGIYISIASSAMFAFAGALCS